MWRHQRTLLAGILVAFAACGLAEYFRQVQRARARARIEQLGGIVAVRHVFNARFRWVADYLGTTNIPFLSNSETVIFLDRTQITDADLALMNRLAPSSLSLRRTHISDEGVKHLAGLTSLQELMLDKSKVTDACLDYVTGIPRLTYLTLTDTAVTEEGVDRFADRSPETFVEHSLYR